MVVCQEIYKRKTKRCHTGLKSIKFMHLLYFQLLQQVGWFRELVACFYQGVKLESLRQARQDLCLLGVLKF